MIPFPSVHFLRIPEPEIMDDTGEVQAYSSAASQAYLGKIDNTFVEHVMRLLPSLPGRAERGSALDIGCGPGQIVLKLAARLPGWQFTGVDRAPNMIRQAVAAHCELARATPSLDVTVHFAVADGCNLPLPDAAFDLVLCNSVLHHLEQPLRLLSEMARVAAPHGALLLRDLRRPSRLSYPLHVRWHGRHYSGLMYKLYCDSVNAAYTPRELAAMLSASPLRHARIFTLGRTHLGFERAPQDRVS